MSRELKFRIYDKTSGYYVAILDNDCFNIEQVARIILELETLKHEYIIEQYTGLTDKNGKEICEGDIVEQFVCGVRERSTNWFVRWNQKECCFELQYLKGSLFGSTMMSDDNVYEIIGNVHDNPSF